MARGEIKLRDFEASASPGNGAALTEAPEAPPVNIPQDLVRRLTTLGGCAWTYCTSPPA